MQYMYYKDYLFLLFNHNKGMQNELLGMIFC